MITILASSPTKETVPEDPGPALDERNGFVDLLRELWPERARCLMIAADPEAYALNDEMTDYYCRAVCNAGLPVDCFDLWDLRCPVGALPSLRQYDVVFLAGGHVATEWNWFRYLHLRQRLEDFDGLVIGTSAGSMNAAHTVYAWPEREGETRQDISQLFFPGLGLARCILLPHYQKVVNARLDGLLFVQDIACSHSFGRQMLAVPDGSFVLAADGEETVFGEAYLVADGIITPFCTEGQTRRFC